MTEFYFIRHGQTDYNIRKDHNKIEHPPHIPLNDTGRAQALAIEPFIAALPIKTICCSPYQRAQETKHLITSRLSMIEMIDLEDLGECNSLIWNEMVAKKQSHHVLTFEEKVKKGLKAALEKTGPVLIVAHGGVHWALCSILNIKDHEWAVDNCVPIHFQIHNNEWKAKALN
jgi:probable phosphoglycerate mutase